MRKVLCGFALTLVGCLIGGGLSTEANAQVTLPAASAASTVPDVVTLKNGSIIYGEVVEMADGVLYIKTAAAADTAIKIKWANVEKLAINHPIPFHLKEGSVLI
ncbi:MAG: hypothetical protein ABI988_16815, partial [Nitrospirota bacterium]